MPPPGALTCPSSEVPVPKAITGTRCSAHTRTTSCTSSADFGKYDAVRRLCRDIGRGVAVLFAHGLAGLEALAEALLENADDDCRRLLVAGDAPQVA